MHPILSSSTDAAYTLTTEKRTPVPSFHLGVFPPFLLQERFRKTARELQRLESVSKSPLYAQFSETLSGRVTIRREAHGWR